MQLAALMAIGAVLAACSVSAKEDGAIEARERKGGFLGLATRAEVEVQTPAAFEQRQRVVIGGFKVGFNESKKMQNKAGSGFGGKSTGLVKLQGVSEATRQQITDRAYRDWIATLEAKGYTIVPRSQLTSNEAYAKVKHYEFPYTSDDSGFLSEYGQATYFSPSAIGDRQPVFMGEIQGVSGGFGFSSPNAAAAEFGKETGIAVLNVTYFVDFAGAEGHGGSWSASSSLQVGQLLAVDRGRLGLTAGHGGTFSDKVGAMELGQPVASQKAFARIEETTSGAEKGVETAANLFSAVLGGGTNQTRKFVYHAEEDKYRAASMEVLRNANQRFVARMVELR
jgi:hypothetical protein